MNQAFNIDPSVTSTFSLDESKDTQKLNVARDFSAVVIGGGTGAPASIKTLLNLGIKTDAIVAMADDGGSTGDLRTRADVTPPGDIRKCLCAFAKDPTDPLTRAFKYRVPAANNHTIGNLLLSSLEDASGSFEQAIEICESLLQCKGHVYPSTLDHVSLSALTRDGQVLEGQAIASKSNTALERVKLTKQDGKQARAYEPACRAIKNSDLIVLGPGSLFTSIIANLLVEGIIDAIRDSRAAVVFVCAIADVQGETWGLSAAEHTKALFAHGMESMIDYCLINKNDGIESDETAHRVVTTTEADISEISAMGPVVVQRNMVDPNHPCWHSGDGLRRAFIDIINLISSRKNS